MEKKWLFFRRPAWGLKSFVISIIGLQNPFHCSMAFVNSLCNSLNPITFLSQPKNSLNFPGRCPFVLHFRFQKLNGILRFLLLHMQKRQHPYQPISTRGTGTNINTYRWARVMFRISFVMIYPSFYTIGFKKIANVLYYMARDIVFITLSYIQNYMIIPILHKVNTTFAIEEPGYIFPRQWSI